MSPFLFAQVGLGVNLEVVGIAAILFSLSLGACVMGSLGLGSLISRPPRAVEAIVVGSLGLVSWCGEVAAAYFFGVMGRSVWGDLWLFACGIISLTPVLIGARMLRQRGG